MMDRPDWYVERPEPEAAHRGTLRSRAMVTSPGGRDRSPYELERPGASLAIYAPDLEEALAGCVGQHVLLIAKTVDLSHEGFGVELWVCALDV